MGRKYLGGSGSALTVWISLAASTVLVFYGYDQVCFESACSLWVHVTRMLMPNLSG
jgi:hypothetical protein